MKRIMLIIGVLLVTHDVCSRGGSRASTRPIDSIGQSINFRTHGLTPICCRPLHPISSVSIEQLSPPMMYRAPNNLEGVECLRRPHGDLRGAIGGVVVHGMEVQQPMALHQRLPLATGGSKLALQLENGPQYGETQHERLPTYGLLHTPRCQRHFSKKQRFAV